MKSKTTKTAPKSAIAPIIAGSAGFSAAGFARATLASQLAFDLGRAAVKQANPANDRPVFDDSINEVFADDNGLPTATVLDVGSLTEGYAAAFLLLRDHIKTPHPETGRREEHLLRFLLPPKAVIQAAASFRAERMADNSVQQAQATAAMLGVDPTARVNAIKAEQSKNSTIECAAIDTAFVAALRTMKGWSVEDLVDTAVEAMADAGRDPTKEIQRSAVAFLDSQRKRMAEGKFVAIDAGIYSLAPKATA